MGWEYEVAVWGLFEVGGDYRYETTFTGSGFLGLVGAVKEARRLRSAGFACVQITWRPN